jgi:CDP-glucose 4,6-dehydratase
LVTQNLWKGKKVLITGLTGFKGSWLCLSLQILGAEVYGISLLSEESSRIYKKVVQDKIIGRHFDIDIRDRVQLNSKIAEINPDVIFHLAAQSLVKTGIDEPIKTFETNFLGTLNILEAARNAQNLKSLMVVTTDKVYKNEKTHTNFKEEDEIWGVDPYSASKASVEILVSSYVKTFFIENTKVNIVVARAGNVIGGGDSSPNRIVPDYFRSLAEKRNLILRNPESIRPWQHVLDCLCGYLMLAEASLKGQISQGEAFNFGPSNLDFQTVAELVKTLNEFSIEANLPTVETDQGVKNFQESDVLTLDSLKASKTFGWKPRADFRNSVQLTAEWEIADLSGNDLVQISEMQIRGFLNV